MADRAAFITGGSSGIGYAIAEALAADGYALTVVARRPEKLEGAVAGLTDAGATVNPIAADVSDEQAITDAFAGHRERYGRLDVLVNNAGLGIGRPLEQIEAKYLDKQLAVNIRATVLCTREATPMLKEAGAEHAKALVVNMASYSGVAGQPFISVYGATKAAIMNFSEATQKELGGSGVQVTAICPGFVDTSMSDFIREQIPAEKMMQPSDIVEGVRMLLAISPNCRVPQLVMAREDELSGSMI